MTNEYDSLMQKYYPKELMIEIFSQYYGEDKREFIEKVIDEVPVIFIVKDMLSFKIKQTFKGDAEKDGVELIEKLQEFAKGKHDQSTLEALIKNDTVIKDFGFDVKKIIKKNILTGKFSTISSEEAESFKNFIIYSVKDVKKFNDVVDINSVVEYYNKFVNEEKYFAINPTIEDDKLVIKNNDNLVLKHYFTNHKYETAKKLLNLTEEDEQFLIDLITSKNDLKFVEDKNGQHIIKNINRLFGTNHKTIDGVLNDGNLKFFIEVITITRKNVIPLIRDSNIEKQNYISLGLNEEIYTEFLQEFRDNPVSAIHSMNPKLKNEYIVLQLDNLNYDLRVVLHELNHALAVNDDYKNSGITIESTPLNEIINEFLTGRAIQNYKGKLEDVDSKSVYDPGINFMEKFLIAFEGKFKESQLVGKQGKAMNVLNDYFGFLNFFLVQDYVKKMERLRWGSIIERNAINTDILTWLEDYKKDPNILNEIPEDYFDDMITIIEFNNYLDKMIECKMKFERGEEHIINPNECSYNNTNNKTVIS